MLVTIIVNFLYSSSVSLDKFNSKLSRTSSFLPEGFISFNLSKTTLALYLPMSLFPTRKLVSKSSSVTIESSYIVTLTPAKMRFLASYVLGPFAGVISTLEWSSLNNRKLTFSEFPSQWIFAYRDVSFPLCWFIHPPFCNYMRLLYQSSTLHQIDKQVNKDKNIR